MDVKVLNKKEPKLENGCVVIEENTKTTMSKQDLLNAKENCRRQKANIAEQSKRFKEQWLSFDAKEKETDELLKLIPDEVIETL